MSDESEREHELSPVIVSVSGYDEGDQAIKVYAQPVTDNNLGSDYEYPTAIGYASPPVATHATSVRAQSIPQRREYQGSLIPPLRFGNVDHLQQPVAFHIDERIIRLTNMSRSVKCLAVLDLFLLLFLAVFQFSWVFLVWGPVFGYFGTNRYKLRLVYVYLFYWGLRALTDAIIGVMLGYWWFIISFLVDLYILRYIWQFCVLLKSVPSASLLALQNASDVNQATQAYPNASSSRV